MGAADGRPRTSTTRAGTPGAEVDLLLELDGRLHPVEIKATTHPSRRDTTGISAFRAALPGDLAA